MTTDGNAQASAPWHLWVIGVLTLLFNAMGILSYMTTQLGMLAEMGMTPEQIAFMESFPAWSTAFWALGVWGAFAGSVLLLLRSRWAVAAMVVALIGLVGTTIAETVVLDVPAGLETPLPLKVAIWGVTLGLSFYARRMAQAGVLR
ncbi:hypothetical protein [Porphyrobacter sp. YT40]|uniref:hypothetical protein n=1 Tax=Porphyrobacter sp. YT40 TaxID=2547601 RepID=UPI0011433C76|nr:hypothetical protein [Porphyrobacter sp. YT40]QDH35542.1 hypothetical protein E2E27_15210 [Porphyrobacter sp. YT40]